MIEYTPFFRSTNHIVVTDINFIRHFYALQTKESFVKTQLCHIQLNTCLLMVDFIRKYIQKLSQIKPQLNQVLK